MLTIQNQSKKLLRSVKATFLAVSLIAAGATVAHAAESDGTFDTSWGGGAIMYGANITDGSQSVDVQGLSDNSYIVLSSLKTTGANSPTGFVLNKFTSLGVADTSFSTDGQVEYPMPGSMGYMEPALLRILSDGSMLAIGHYGGNSAGGAFIVKFDSTGTIVSSFGTGGIATAATTSNDSAMYYSTFIAPSGNIYVMSKMNVVTITRFTSAGALDTTGFGSSGAQGYFAGSIGSSTYYWRGFSVDESSTPAKILLWGADNANGNVVSTRWNMAATSGRIQPSTIDSTYATSGLFNITTGLTSGVPQTKSVVQSSNGNVYMRINQKLIGFNPTTAAAIGGFGSGGVVDISSNGISDFTYVGLSVSTVSSNDVIFATGSNGSAYVIAKYDNTGALVSSFGTAGIKSLALCGPMSITKTIRLNNGAILVSGHSAVYSPPSFALRQIMLGSGGSTAQCGTTTTTTTMPQGGGSGGSGGNGGNGGGGGGMLATPAATAVEVPGQGIRVTITNLAAGAHLSVMAFPVGTSLGMSVTELPWATEGAAGATTLLVYETVWIPSSGSMANPVISRRTLIAAGTSYTLRVFQTIGAFANPSAASPATVLTVAATTNASATTVPTTTTPTTTTVPKAATTATYANAIPGVTVTDPTVYTKAPVKVSADSAINAMTPTEAKMYDIVSKTPSVCLPNDEDLVFLDDGKCIATIVNEKTRAVLRTLKTTVVADDISTLKVGNEVAVLSPLYFDAGSADMKPTSVTRLKSLYGTMRNAGSILIAGHSGTLMGNTPENQALSKKRAQTVVAAIRKLGSKADIAIAAVGALDPAAKGTSEAAQNKNRRAVIVLIP